MSLRCAVDGARLFTDADLRGANLAGARLDGASFDAADLRGAAVSGARLYECEPVRDSPATVRFRRPVASWQYARLPHHLEHLMKARRTTMLEAGQLELPVDVPRRGGRRKGAGRRPTGLRRGALHRRRPRVTRHRPVHVSLPIERVVGRMRRRAGYRAVRRGIAVCIARPDMRIVHASIQANHVHLLIEASDEGALSRGLRAFMTACARHLNAHLGRRGRVFAGRYHMTVVTSPRHARSALSYVLNNWRRHHEDRGARATRAASVDPYSTGILFDSWAERRGRFPIPDDHDPLPVTGARSWLLTVGWRSAPPIRLREVPGPEPR